MGYGLRHALRLIRKSPGFAAVAVLTLAVGIGANTAIFSVVDALLLRPLPVADPARLVFISRSNPQRGGSGIPLSVPAYEMLRDGGGSFSGIAAFAREGMTLTGADDPEQLTAARVSPNLFEVLGVSPALGRTFQSAEGEAGGRPVVILSHRLWERRFASDTAILGRSITLAQTPYTVIGVAPADLPLPYADTDVWITRIMNYSGLQAEQIRHGAGFLMGIARLKPGVALRQAQAEIDLLGRRYRDQHAGNPDADPWSRTYAALLADALVSEIRPTLLILSGAVGLVLLVACANVAGLLLARATGRAREIAIRAALGAGRGGLVRQLLAESLLLSTAGAALGTVLADWGVAAFVKSDSGSSPAFQSIHINGQVLAFTIAVSLATGIAFGLVPALHATRPDLTAVLRDSGWGTTTGGRRLRLRGLLVAGQMALSIVLLIGAGLLVESFRQVRSARPGFDPRGAVTMRVSLPPARYSDDARRTAFVRELLSRMEVLPGARSASVSVGLPMSIGVMAPFLAEGQPTAPMGQRPLGEWKAITPAYFQTMGIPLVRGRPFTWNDDERAPKRVIVSQTLARRFWGDTDPVGRHILYARREFDAEIVGVAADVKERGLESDAGMVFYTPYPQFSWPSVQVTVRTAGDPRALINAARAQVFAVDRDLPVTGVETLETFLDGLVAQRRQTMYLIGGFAGVALLLALIGLYGAMAYSVAQRTAEIGIRQAVGARRADILRMVLGDGLRLSAAGIAAGVAASLVLTRLIAKMLYHVSATDPATFAVIALLMLAVTLAASCLPAWRATRVDPLEALRG
jgi:putative ABC transport system permease protein